MAHHRDVDVFIEQQIASRRTFGWLMQRIFREEEPDAGRAALRELAEHWQDRCQVGDTAEDVFQYYCGMRAALVKSNGEKLKLYRHHRRLFEIQVSRLLGSSAFITTQWRLVAAGIMARFGFSGALRMCDGAAFDAFYNVYTAGRESGASGA